VALDPNRCWNCVAAHVWIFEMPNGAGNEVSYDYWTVAQICDGIQRGVVPICDEIPSFVVLVSYAMQIFVVPFGRKDP
jgi:hypothetical protein